MGGSLTEIELKDALKRFNKLFAIHPANFVETGTYKGVSSRLAAKHIKKVYTIEIVKDLYLESKEIAEKEELTNIVFYNGDSVIVLHEIMKRIKEESIFFIDAHRSGFDSGQNGKSVPLIDEMDAILVYKLRPSLFIIDDLRFWNGQSEQAWDWADVSVESVNNKFAQHGYEILDSYCKDDRYYVYVSKNGY